MARTSRGRAFCPVLIGLLLCGCVKQDIPLALPRTELPGGKQRIMKRFEVAREKSCRTLEFSGCIDVVAPLKRSDAAVILTLRYFDAEGKPYLFKELPHTKMFGEPVGYCYLSGAGGRSVRFSRKVAIPEVVKSIEVGLSRGNNDWQIALKDFQCVISRSILKTLIHVALVFYAENLLVLSLLFSAAFAIIAVLLSKKIIPVRPFVRAVATLALSFVALAVFANSEEFGNRQDFISWQVFLWLAALYASGGMQMVSKMAWVGKMNGLLSRQIPERSFDVAVTNVCKGVAICLLLFHHCLELYGDKNPIEITLQHGGKLCIAIFCMLSGFGLMRMKMRGAGFKMDFFHLVKLLVNFWFVAAIWILFSCHLEGRGFVQVYPMGWNPRFFYDISGLGAPGHCFCPTWWYMGVVIPLYLTFPFLSWLCRKSWPWLLVVALCVMLVENAIKVGVWTWCVWTWVFALGMIMAKEGAMEKIERSLCYLSAAAFLVIAALVLHVRSYFSTLPLYEGFVAGLFVFAIYVMEAAFLSRVRILEWVLVFLGKHSMNIFLIHPYFNMYYKKFLQQFSPMVGFAMVLAASLACSMAVERLKWLLGIKWAMGKLRKQMT